MLSTIQIGAPISSELSEYLKIFTSKQDVADLATKINVSTSTIRDVKLRTNTVSEKSAPAVDELVKIAVANCDRAMEQAKAAKRFFLKQLQEVGTVV